MFSNGIQPVSLFLDEAKQKLGDSPAEYLRGLCRITSEFDTFINSHIDYLRQLAGEIVGQEQTLKIENNQNAEELSYMCGTIFSGIDSFLFVNHNYKSTSFLTGHNRKDQIFFLTDYISGFRNGCDLFLREHVFMEKYGIFINMFRIQILFATMMCGV